MRALLAIMMFGAGALYGGHRWLQSPQSLNLLVNRRKGWSGTAIFYLGLYRSFFKDWLPAQSVFDACSSESFKDDAHQGDCLYYRAWVLDERRQWIDAPAAYQVFIERHPNHPKVSLARRRIHIIEESRKI